MALTKAEEKAVLIEERDALDREHFRVTSRIKAGKAAGLDDYVKQHTEQLVRLQSLLDAINELIKKGEA